MIRLETAEMVFLRSVAGYRMLDHKRNEDIKKELGMMDASAILNKLRCRTCA
jgi:hypothetical protein